MPRRQPPKTGITDWISDVTDVFRPGRRPGETRQVETFRSTARNVVSTGAAAVDMLATGGVAGSFGRNVVQPAATVGSPARRRDAERRGVQQFGRDAGAAAAGYAAGLGVGGVAGKVVSNVKAARQAGKFDWDPKPYSEFIRTPERASFYWKPQTDVVNPTNPDISYTVAVRPANPRASMHGRRSADKGYKVEVSRFSAEQVNTLFDSAAEYNKIVGAKPLSSANAPTSSQLFQDLQSNKVYTDLKKAQRAAERLVKRDTKRR